jgi:hypothetical protein
MKLYYVFLAINLSSKLEDEHDFFFYLFVAKQHFFTGGKDRTLTYQRLIGFMVSFAYLEFLDKRLSLGPSTF